MKDIDLWFKNAVFYQVYVRAFRDANGDGQGDLDGLKEKLGYLKDLGVDCIWMMPIYPSPLRDDGYDVADFRSIDPVYGSVQDLRELIEAVHALGMRLITDLVMNHTSDQHPWFQAARADPSSAFRDYYVWSDTGTQYSEARIIFLDVEPSNWTWDAQAGQFYWHRFYASQPDLNYANPRVQEEMLDVARFWLDLGIDGFRADAVPYLFEQEGTDCENLPPTHAYLRRLRQLIDREFPGRVLLCEANQPPEAVREYFGEGDEFHLGFHFPLMPRLYMALAKGHADDLRSILQRTPSIPETCQWCTFLRNHDELTLEMVTPAERDWMWEHYAPEPRMRLNLGIRRRLAPLLDNDQRKIELIHSLLLTLPGAPIIYYGDEIGMGDNIWLPDRNGVRTPMQWDAGANGGFSTAPEEKLYAPVISTPIHAPARVNVQAQRRDAASLWNALRRMLMVRRAHRAFGWGGLDWVDTGNDHITGFRRALDDEQILVLHNLTDTRQSMVLAEDQPLSDLLDSRHWAAPRLGQMIDMQPYEYRWLISVAEPSRSSSAA